MSLANSAKYGLIEWTELTVKNAEQVRDFYSSVVAWKVEEVDMGGYRDFSMVNPSSGSPVAGICRARGPMPISLRSGWTI